MAAPWGRRKPLIWFSEFFHCLSYFATAFPPLKLLGINNTVEDLLHSNEERAKRKAEIHRTKGLARTMWQEKASQQEGNILSKDCQEIKEWGIFPAASNPLLSSVSCMMPRDPSR